MKNETRKLYTGFLENIADLNNVDDVTVSFAVDPSVAQKLETKQQESSAFLGRINVFLVDELEGETVGIVSSGPIASRTDVSTKDRQTKSATGEVAQRYRCEETDYNTHISWAKLDQWAKFDDFEVRIQSVIVNQQALDRIRIGFNGTHVAVESDLTKYPNLQDMNIGWLQELRLKSPTQVVGSTTVKGASDRVPGVTTPEPVKVGPAQEFKNLDAVVIDGVELLDPWHRERTDLIVIVGRKLVHDKYFKVINQADKPTEMLAADVIMSEKRLGGLPAVRVPFFPENALLITTFENLSIYVQEESRRRHLEENARRKRIEDFQSSNDDYVIEDHGLAVLVENITFDDTAPTA